MKTVTLDVRSRAEVLADVGKVWKSGKAQKTARISFATPELLWKVLTASDGNCSRRYVDLARYRFAKRHDVSIVTSKPFMPM